ncbi:hypothetical protein [Flavobacterium okayamense]|uniref:Bacteriocin-type signal sequence-containing protein n=1 Tax=Flavobacterium okayamense TaxID=2830782 RepID=A0ABM7S233_9FLAO|nr:hypothetical protein [Flavobacterium okayamense]BCY27578.1 hypothetical protein KK2020170_04460 [Flavobacterium okayamense]
MSKLSLDALKERAEATTSNELLATISGGTENSCHDSLPDTADYTGNPIADIFVGVYNLWQIITN